MATAYEKVQLARGKGRPSGLSFIQNIFPDFIELHGDRRFADDPAVIGGIATLGGSGCLVGVIAGASIWAILQNGLTLAGVPVAIRNIVIGLIVVACVLADIMRRGGRKSK